MPAKTSTLTGSSGAYYVMYQLLRRDKIAALAPEGVPNIDLLISDLSGEKVGALQVKTRNQKGTDGGWSMRSKHEDIIGKNLFYCFVEFDKNELILPNTWIVHSKIVAKVLKDSYELWFSTPGKNGRRRNETDLRRFLPDYSKTLPSDHSFTKNHSAGWLDQYKNRWDLLD